jgi:hypothetical protein
MARLRQLSLEGASTVRVAAALNRRITSVARMARRGISLAGTREMKAAIRALDPRAAFFSDH